MTPTTASRLTSLLALALLASGCGGSTSSPGPAAQSYPAPHPAMPQVTNLGGPVMAAPVVHAVTFSDDDPGAVSSIQGFLTTLAASSYWPAAANEYGVGTLQQGPAVNLAETSPGTIDDVEVQAWLADKLNGDDPAFPVAGANTIYAVFYPATTTVTASTTTGCVDFGAYHSSLQLDAAHANRDVAYLVVPRCSSFDALTGLDALTAATSATLVGTATDPFPMSTPAWAQPDDDHLVWLFALGGGEVSSLCAQFQDSFYTPTDVGHVVQRTWSNKAALAGHDPCVPAAAGRAYFNTSPVLADPISLGGGSLTTRGVIIPGGQSKTIELDLYSDAATTGPWTVSALDWNTLTGGSPQLGFALDRASGSNGDKLHLTITSLSATNSYTPATFVVVSTLGSTQHLWVGLAGSE